ncbi:uncharacterized protein LOC124946919 [Vespa velutina]|uniref:uncharacterized protein LOC124946919 n=1 Tax=Vespa velutina TaxID=202808 RepID=UPI001FB26A98|nr:uncharacterized protein LOC124946919 [Vespa velutina]
MSFIKLELSQLNKLLKNMLTTTIDSPQHKRVLRRKNIRKKEPLFDDIRGMYKSKEDVRRIKKAREIHLEIIKCARTVNDCFGIHILFSISTALILITIMSYNIFDLLKTTNGLQQILQNYSFLYWVFHFAIKIVIVSHVCARTVTEKFQPKTERNMY